MHFGDANAVAASSAPSFRCTVLRTANCLGRYPVAAPAPFPNNSVEDVRFTWTLRIAWALKTVGLVILRWLAAGYYYTADWQVDTNVSGGGASGLA